MARRVCIVGSGVGVAGAALSLAEIGIPVTLVTPDPCLDPSHSIAHKSNASSHDFVHLWPLFLRVTNHPRVKVHTKSRIKSVSGNPGKWVLVAEKTPRYVNEELCTGCGRCEQECSVQVQLKGRKGSHTAIHSPVPGIKSAPSAYCIEKNGVSPCRSSCPLGINIQGYIALIAKGKVDKASALINDIAPLAGVLGRLCTHPCETRCAREKIDNPVFIQALHRYAADNVSESPVYTRKASPGSHKAKIAIVGSGPAGLTAAWELARRGYTPTIFESHAVAGGMLATGIPRFRLPHEIREKELEAIRSLGVDIKTGVTVGTDVTYGDLLDRGFKAFFLAIGAHQGNRLNIPGEDLEGVSDSISLLLALNLKVGTAVGSNVVVIGGGNSAVDAARSAKRVSKGEVLILCITDTMTAVKDEVDEALQEGVRIDYNVSAVEIVGENGKVCGVRCKRVSHVTFGPDGMANPEYMPESEFIVPADHVVISVGQRPNSAALNIKNLKIRNNSTIGVDPLTMETAIKGVFAGGDATTGSNNVVDAVAAGLRAAESIDRYLNNRDLMSGRAIEPPAVPQVDIDEKRASPFKRVHMPALTLARRRSNYEETNLGLTEDLAQRESARCLNCSICCECMECESVCELNAINHEDKGSAVKIECDSIINFVSEDGNIQEIENDGVHNVGNVRCKSLTAELSRASSIAMSVAAEQRSRHDLRQTGKKRDSSEVLSTACANVDRKRNKTALFLCRCGGTISSVVDFEELQSQITGYPQIHSVQELSQACTEEGARFIKSIVQNEDISSIVLAACRCCNQEQICFSCSDRRVKCQNNLNVELPKGVGIEFVNIREHCAWVHGDDRVGATRNAAEIIKAGIQKIQDQNIIVYTPKEIVNKVLVLGTSLAGLAAASCLTKQRFPVMFAGDIGEIESARNSLDYAKTVQRKLDNLAENDVQIIHSLEHLDVLSSGGAYEVAVNPESPADRMAFGSIILDLSGIEGDSLEVLRRNSFFGRFINHGIKHGQTVDFNRVSHNSFTMKETAGIFCLIPSDDATTNELVHLGESVAARALAFISYSNEVGIKPRSSAVVINRKLCRSCGDCAKVCSYIEMINGNDGCSRAVLDPALCFGCGACISVCPTGAITQPSQTEKYFTNTLNSFSTTNSPLVVFACNWDGFSCIEDAAQKRLFFPASTRIIRVNCLSRVHTGLILEAFERGANGVMMLGCESQNCHFRIDEEVVRGNIEKSRFIMKLLGLKQDKLALVRLLSSDGEGFAKAINDFSERLSGDQSYVHEI